MTCKTFQCNCEFRVWLPIFSKQSESIDKFITLFHYFEATLLTTLKNRRNIIVSSKSVEPDLCCSYVVIQVDWVKPYTFTIFAIPIINYTLRSVNEAYRCYHDVIVTRGGPKNDWTLGCANDMYRMKYHHGIRFFLIWRQFIHSCYLWCVHLHTNALFRKIYDGCLRPVRRAGDCVTKQIYEPVLIFTISQESLKIFWYLRLSRFNDDLITASTTFYFSSRNWDISVMLASISTLWNPFGKEDNIFHVNSS